MSTARREEFIQSVRRSAKSWQLLTRAALWLTPKTVEQYHADDFLDWPESQRDQLQKSVDGFRLAASQVPADQPATELQLRDGAKWFQAVTEIVAKMVREEWLQTINELEAQVEEWSTDAGWRTRRVAKKLSESLLGSYDAPQLLIFAEPNLYVLDPVARFVPGSLGTFDFALQPSYETMSLYRDDLGEWRLHLKGDQIEWNQEAFHEAIDQLKVLV